MLWIMFNCYRMGRRKFRLGRLPKDFERKKKHRSVGRPFKKKANGNVQSVTRNDPSSEHSLTLSDGEQQCTPSMYM